jgi:hypothetical protein
VEREDETTENETEGGKSGTVSFGIGFSSSYFAPAKEKKQRQEREQKLNEDVSFIALHRAPRV